MKKLTKQLSLLAIACTIGTGSAIAAPAVTPIEQSISIVQPWNNIAKVEESTDTNGDHVMTFSLRRTSNLTQQQFDNYVARWESQLMQSGPLINLSFDPAIQQVVATFDDAGMGTMPSDYMDKFFGYFGFNGGFSISGQ